MWLDRGTLEKVNKELAGKMLIALEIDLDRQHYARLVTDDGVYVIYAEGDCCSESWFADALYVPRKLPVKLSSIEGVRLPDPPNDGRTRQEYDQAYSVRIHHDGLEGSTELVFRNSSNGYYGGWFSVYRQDDPVVTWAGREIQFAPILDDGELG